MGSQANSVHIALGGIIASLAVAAIPTFTSGTPATANILVNALDAAGYTIIGTDVYDVPITLTTTDGTGTFKVSTTQLTSPSSTSTVSYAGSGATTAAINANVAGTSASASTPVAATTVAVTSTQSVKFGTFARAAGTPPFGMFTSSGALDPTKTQNILDIGASWTRFETSPFYIDQTVFGAGKYDFTNVDLLAGWQTAHTIEPVVGIEAGPVEVNATPGTFSPTQVPIYPTPAAFATFCSALSTHMNGLGTHSYSEPGNEVNSDAQKYPNGAASVAPYAEACYKAIKAVDPAAFVWGLELNMDGQINAPGFVSTLLSLGCGPGTCYDGISIHLSLRYPLPPAGTPCYPAAGGDYSTLCVAAIQTAAGNPTLPIMIGETVITWAGMVSDAATQALAVPATLEALKATPGVKYINYANLDECALYPSGYFMNGCLVDVNNAHVPAWTGAHNVFAGG